jgi:hypothetical protein
MVTSPATFAKYSQGGPVGILPYQNMFETDSTRDGIFAARNSFVRMLNNIFSQNPISTDRPDAVAALSVETPIDQYLVWRRAPGTTHIEVIPPSTEWDVQVNTMSERDFFIINPTVITQIMSGNSYRILVNGIGNEDAPQWSVWTAALSNAPDGTTENEVLNNPSLIFALTLSYDYHAASIADRDLLLQATSPITVGQRVLVDGDTSTGGFWTIWEYVGPQTDPDVDASGFKLTRYQTYRTADFWNFVDYYASGYFASNPPIVTYATTAARDAAENPPKSSLVKINNDGTGSWIWTAFVDGQWTMVARQNGTIEFSPKFYSNTSLPTIGMEPITLSVLADIPNRDGSWELRVMFDLLQDVTLLEALEVNEVFFSMLHFVHAQQDQVAWAFKTSFMNIGGYNEQLTQTPVTPVDNTTNLTDYLAEVAPYRVKIRNFTQIITPPLDNAVVHATDFDFPPYYDAVQQKYRELDLTVPADLAIIQNTAPWSDWYSTYLNPEFRSDNYDAKNWNGVRHFFITLLFDRVDHMPVLTTQWFTFEGSSTFFVDFTGTGVTDLRNQIVEVYVNDVRLADDEFSSNIDALTINSSMDASDLIRVVVRASLSAGLSASRIQQFYNPILANEPEKNLRALMGLEYKTPNVNDGGDLADNSLNDYTVSGNYTGIESDETINPNESHFGLADPAHDQDRPEELVIVGTGESLVMLSWDNTNVNAVTLIATARPSTDLMVVDNSTTQTGNYTFRKDSWETEVWSNVGGILTIDLYSNANTISITLNNTSVLPFSMPSVELVNDDIGNHEINTDAGVVWINGERVEFFECNTVSNPVILSQIRRGTHNTRIGLEQLKVYTFVGDGSTRNFTIPTADANNITVAVNQIGFNQNGQLINSPDYDGSYAINIPKMFAIDYTLTQTGNAVTLSFLAPPPLSTGNANVFVTQTIDQIKHPAGTQIFTA